MNWTVVCRDHKRRLLHAVAASILSTYASSAGARPPAIDAELTVMADPSCATRADLVERVHLHSQRIRFVEGLGRNKDTRGDATGVQLLVEVAELPASGHDAKITITWPDGRMAERHLNARSCGPILDALGLLVAMSLDPAARPEASDPPTVPSGGAEDGGSRGGATRESAPDTGRRTPRPKRPAVRPARRSARPAPAEARAASVAARESEQRGTTPADAAPMPPPPASSASSASSASKIILRRGPRAQADASRPRFSLGMEPLVLGFSGHLLFGVAPETMPGLGAFATLALGGRGLWRPALSLQVRHAWIDGITRARGTATIELSTVALDLCPLGIRRPSVTARACLAGNVGRLTARGSHSYSPQTQRKPWASLGGTALLAVQLTPWLSLDAGLGLAAPLFRYGFAFRPQVFHRIPKLHFYGHLGTGVRFP